MGCVYIQHCDLNASRFSSLLLKKIERKNTSVKKKLLQLPPTFLVRVSLQDLACEICVSEVLWALERALSVELWSPKLNICLWRAGTELLLLILFLLYSHFISSTDGHLGIPSGAAPAPAASAVPPQVKWAQRSWERLFRSAPCTLRGTKREASIHHSEDKHLTAQLDYVRNTSVLIVCLQAFKTSVYLSQ